MLFPMSDRAQDIRRRVTEFMDAHVYAAEAVYAQQLDSGPSRWAIPPVIDELKAKAKAAGLWNLFLPNQNTARGLTNLEYAPLCEIMGRSPIGAGGLQLLGAGHRQHGNARALRDRRTEEALARAAARGQHPLLLCDDRARRRLLATPPTSAPRSAATATDYVINGRKWWTSGAGDPRCKIAIFMGKTNPDGRAAQAAVDDPGADGHARASRSMRHAQRVRLRRCAARPRRGVVRERARAGREHAARRGPRLRDRARPPRAGPHPSLHAHHRHGRARAGDDVPARAARVAFGRPLAEQGVTAARDRRIAHGDRPGAAADAAGRAHDGHGRQQGRARRNRDDQGGGAEHGAARSSTAPSRPTAAAASARTSPWPMPGRARARCAWPTAPTRCTARPIAKLELAKHPTNTAQDTSERR